MNDDNDISSQQKGFTYNSSIIKEFLRKTKQSINEITELRIEDKADQEDQEFGPLFSGALNELKILKFENIELVCLNRNRIPNFPAINAKNLKVLDLFNSQIKSLDDFAQAEYPSLEQIKATNNRLTSLPKFNAPNIQILDFTFNSIKDKGLKHFLEGNYPQLKRLLLLQNKLQTILIIKSNKLQSLIIHGNRIKENEQSKQHKQLKKQKQITSVQFKNTIENISFSVNQLIKIPQIMFKICNLITLDLSYNLILSIQRLSSCYFEKLEYLSLKANNVRSLASLSKSHLPSMRTLLLQHNFVKQIKPLQRSKFKKTSPSDQQKTPNASFSLTIQTDHGASDKYGYYRQFLKLSKYEEQHERKTYTLEDISSLFKLDIISFFWAQARHQNQIQQPKHAQQFYRIYRQKLLLKGKK